MAVRLKKRKKSTRMRGTRTHGWAMKKHKGSGNRGGKGMSGTGKRADQRKTWVIRYRFPYFGKQGFTSRGTERKKTQEINLRDIENKYLRSGIKEINLSKYKILGEGDIKGLKGVTIKAGAASKSAIAKIEKAGGKIVLPNRNKYSEKTLKTEKPIAKKGN